MDSFAKRWLGRRVDYDKVYYYQCVDLIKQYWWEVYRVASGAWGNAIDYWTRPNATMLKYFDKIAGSNAVKGDVVVMWGLSGNPYGHIAIASGRKTTTQLEVLEQNGSTGNGSGIGADAIRYRYIPRSRVAGLLRRKAAPKPATPVAAVTQYIVRAGDTLGGIAKRFGLTLANLLKLNPAIKNPNVIYPNQKITIKAQQQAAARTVIYTVKKGDTVGAICRTFRISLATFKKLNPGVKNINLIYPGQRVRIK